MALSQFVKQVLQKGLLSQVHAKELADVIDAGSGTLSENCKNRIIRLSRSQSLAAAFITAVESGSGFTAEQQNFYSNLLASRAAGSELYTELS